MGGFNEPSNFSRTRGASGASGVQTVDIALAAAFLPILPHLLGLCDGSDLLVRFIERRLARIEANRQMPSVSSRRSGYAAPTFTPAQPRGLTRNWR